MRAPVAWAAMALVVTLGVGASAQPVDATLELVAVGSFSDPHEITVLPGDTVTLAYMVSNAEKLAFFEDNLLLTGPASSLAVVGGASWWEAQANTMQPTLREQSPGVYKLLGESGTAGPPYSHSTVDPRSLAVLEFTCQGPGTVTVEALLGPVLAMAEPETGLPLGKQPIDQFSNGLVTIHQGPPGLRYRVAEGQEAFGEIERTDPDPDTILLVAGPFDPSLYEFDFWTETTGAPIPGGGPYSATLTLPSDAVLDLVAHFVLIPEPLSATLLSVGLAGLALVRRRRRA